MAQIKISAQEAQEKAESLKAKISQVIFRFQTSANKEKLIAETIEAITVVSQLFGRDANLVVMVDCQIPADDLVVHFL